MHRAVRDRSRARTIIGAVAAFHGIDQAELTGLRRDRHVSWARQEACWALRLRTSLSTPSIGRLLNRDHTTVVSANAAVERRRAGDLEYRQTTDALLGHIDRVTANAAQDENPADALAPVLRELAGLHARLIETLSAVEVDQADIAIIQHHGAKK